jgi:hypothetical protein
MRLCCCLQMTNCLYYCFEMTMRLCYCFRLALWLYYYCFKMDMCLCCCFVLTCHALIHPTTTVCCVLVDCSETNIPQTPTKKRRIGKNSFSSKKSVGRENCDSRAWCISALVLNKKIYIATRIDSFTVRLIKG